MPCHAALDRVPRIRPSLVCGAACVSGALTGAILIPRCPAAYRVEGKSAAKMRSLENRLCHGWCD